MRITGIDSLVFGVEDVAQCQKFCEDFGLVRRDGDAVVLDAMDGSSLELRPLDDLSLPATDRTGSTLRLLIWGVQDEAALDEIAQELSKDREVRREDGIIHSIDPQGQALAFRVTQKRLVSDPLPAANVPGHFQRKVNERVDYKHAVRPRGIAHVVFDCAEEAATRAFYVERLGFIVSDSFRDTGAFLRTSIAKEHHSLFTVQRTPAGLNHVAFYVTDFHEVMLGGMRMQETGWATRWGPGRHKLGSNYFWYFHSPLGGALEYTCDVDHVDEHWQPVELEFSPANAAMWSAQGIIASI
jgi:catechol 2,3-dioxygenase-like lactoylglutathione lyase family enzyme